MSPSAPQTTNKRILIMVTSLVVKLFKTSSSSFCNVFVSIIVIRLCSTGQSNISYPENNLRLSSMSHHPCRQKIIGLKPVIPAANQCPEYTKKLQRELLQIIKKVKIFLDKVNSLNQLLFNEHLQVVQLFFFYFAALFFT